jgi:hypothetical protein
MRGSHALQKYYSFIPKELDAPFLLCIMRCFAAGAQQQGSQKWLF